MAVMNPLPVFDTDSITYSDVSLNQGSWHRAIVVARHLFEHGIWDGHTPITIHNPYNTHHEMGWSYPLQENVHYTIKGREDINRRHFLVIPHNGRDLLVQQPELSDDDLAELGELPYGARVVTVRAWETHETNKRLAEVKKLPYVSTDMVGLRILIGSI